jgi:hypothetical protein
MPILPNGGGGYQIGTGNASEARLIVQGAPTALTAAATATVAQLVNGLFTFNGTAGNLTLPTVAELEAGIPNATRVGIAFDFHIINIDATTDDVTVAVAAGTGWTLVGNMVVTETVSGHFRARKTGVGAWTLYRMS